MDMKTVAAALLAAAGVCAGAKSSATPSADDFHSVTNDWWNGNFTNEYGAVRSAWGYFLTDAAPALTDAQLADQHAKSAQPHRRMVMERILRVIDECGLWGAQGGEGGNGGE